MVVEGESYHMGGECIETTLESIHNALEGGDWSIEKSDELELSGDFWTMQVYEVGSGGTFLLGGAFFGEVGTRETGARSHSPTVRRSRNRIPHRGELVRRTGPRREDCSPGLSRFLSLYPCGPAKLTP